LSELEEKVKASIERLKAFEPEEGYYLAFSGGKDSVVCKALLDMAGCKYDATYRVTSVDPPELVRFIKEKHPDVKREVPRYKDGSVATMWNLIPKKLMPPTRIARYCCEVLKEDGGDGRKAVTGVRWAESPSRKQNQGQVTILKKNKQVLKELDGNTNFSSTIRGGVVLTNDNEDSRRMIEHCYKRTKVLINPIIEWEDSDVWDFIKVNKIPYCSLYDEGFSRLGCIGCPMARTQGREKEFIRWPKYKDAYIRSFWKMLDERKKKGKDTKNWETGKDVFNWWMEYDVLPGQINLFEEEN
jgi:phosphoadenosine phosphosulfate reductase